MTLRLNYDKVYIYNEYAIQLIRSLWAQYTFECAFIYTNKSGNRLNVFRLDI